MAIKATQSIEWIDKKKAEKLLSKTHPMQAGRHLAKTIESYAEQMRKGQWDTDVLQTIAIDSTGALMNGYHRLNAIEESNSKLQFLVVRGANPQSFGKWDANAPRPLSYQTGLSIDRTAVISTIIRLALYPGGYTRLT